MGDFSGREPCPYRILDDIGGAYAMGAVGGSIWHFVKGWRNAPKNQGFSGAIEQVKVRAPVVGGNFAVWGGLFACFAPYTYAAYLIHVPVMHWHVFAVANGLDSIADALTIDFARAECGPVSEGFFERGAERENDDLPASELRCYGGSYSYVAGFTTSIVAAVLLVVLVDRPAKALIQRLVNGAP